jgi:chromate transporter
MPSKGLSHGNPVNRTEKPFVSLAVFFLRLGCTAFGGPAAHIALMEQEAVKRRRWLSSEAFLDLLGACNLIPGPSSTQMAMAIAYRQAGWLGLVLGGCCFILPASLLTLAIAWAYVRFGALPQAQGLLYGIKPVVLAIVFQALWNLGKVAFRKRSMIVLGAMALGAVLLGVQPLFVLLGTGLAMMLVRTRAGHRANAGWLALPLGSSGLAGAGLLPLFLIFLKMGVVVFGSGYVLMAFLKADLVDRLHWLSETQLLDAIAVGQFTPGPVFTTATFIGYVLKGLPGAVLATVGIFLPSFFLVGALGILVPKLRSSKTAGAFLDGVNAATIVLMASVTATLARSALVDPWTWGLGILAALFLIRFKPNPTWLIVGGGALGWLIRLLPVF